MIIHACECTGSYAATHFIVVVALVHWSCKVSVSVACNEQIAAHVIVRGAKALEIMRGALSNTRLPRFALAHPSTRTSPNDAEVHSVNVSGRIVLDVKINLLIDPQSKAAYDSVTNQIPVPSQWKTTERKRSMMYMILHSNGNERQGQQQYEECRLPH